MLNNPTPMILRDYPPRRPTRYDTTPKKRRNDSIGSKSRSPQRVATGSSSKQGERRSTRAHYISRSQESIEKELLEYKMASPSPDEIFKLDPQRVDKLLNFEGQESEIMESKKSVDRSPTNHRWAKFLKCKLHNEKYSFFNPEERKLYCTKCFYTKFEILLSKHGKKAKPNVIPLENAMEWINRENKSFIKIEGRQTMCQIDHAISVCNYNNNFLVKKLDMFQRLISKEFDEIREWINRREAELREFTQKFFEEKIRDNIDKLQDLKFLHESLKKLFEINQGSNPEFSIFQFSFTNALKKSIQQINLTATQIHDRDVDVLDFVSKKRIRMEIEALGNPVAVNRSVEMFPTTPRTSAKPRQTSTSHSPVASYRQSGSQKRQSPPKVLPIVNVRAFEQISKDKIPPEYKFPQPFDASVVESLYPILHEKHLFADSTILADNRLKHEALELFPVKLKVTQKLYSLQNDGASSEVFHTACDFKGPYVVLVKTFNKYVFGYYCPLNFTKEEKYFGHENFWIFTLVNDYGRSMIFKIKAEKNFIALYNSEKSPCLGSTLKGKEDLYIDFDDLKNSCSNVGYAYKLWDSKIDGSKILSGKSSDWEFNDIEVYHVE